MRQNERDGERNQYEATEHVETGHQEASGFWGANANLPSRPGIRARDSYEILRNLREPRKKQPRPLATLDHRYEELAFEFAFLLDLLADPASPR